VIAPSRGVVAEEKFGRILERKKERKRWFTMLAIG
jgi:predicted nucleic acid-binding Zn ribbon protein